MIRHGTGEGLQPSRQHELGCDRLVLSAFLFVFVPSVWGARAFAKRIGAMRGDTWLLNRGCVAKELPIDIVVAGLFLHVKAWRLHSAHTAFEFLHERSTLRTSGSGIDRWVSTLSSVASALVLGISKAGASNYRRCTVHRASKKMSARGVGNGFQRLLWQIVSQTGMLPWLLQRRIARKCVCKAGNCTSVVRVSLVSSVRCGFCVPAFKTHSQQANRCRRGVSAMPSNAFCR